MKPKYFITTEDLTYDIPTIYAVYPEGYANFSGHYGWLPSDNATHTVESDWLKTFERLEDYHPVSVSQIRTWYPNFKQHKLIK